MITRTSSLHGRLLPTSLAVRYASAHFRSDFVRVQCRRICSSRALYYVGLNSRHTYAKATPNAPSRRPSSTTTTPTPGATPNESIIKVDQRALPNDSGTVATITISNPSRLNILSISSINQLQQTIDSLATDPTIRAVIFTGAAIPSRTASFCAGANITETETINTPADAESFIRRVHKVCNTITHLKAVTIARIDGLCFGAGLELAACCDFRYGTARSSFSMKEVAVGIPSVVHARLLANIMGWQAAKRMVLLGKVVGAEEAGRHGLVDGVFETPEEMDGRIEEDVNLIGSYGRKAMRVQKELNLYWERNGLEEGIDQGIEAFAGMWEDGGSEPKRYMREWMGRRREKKE